jgi:hypothetical protein
MARPPMRQPRSHRAIPFAVERVFGPRLAATTGALTAGVIARYTVERGTWKTAQIIVSG